MLSSFSLFPGVRCWCQNCLVVKCRLYAISFARRLPYSRARRFHLGPFAHAYQLAHFRPPHEQHASPAWYPWASGHAKRHGSHEHCESPPVLHGYSQEQLLTFL